MREDDNEVRFTLRLPVHLWTSLSEVSVQNKRSLNGEIVARLSGEANGDGETLRDKFAMAALTGLCSAQDPDGRWTSPPEEAAKNAYMHADAMLSARKENANA